MLDPAGQLVEEPVAQRDEGGRAGGHFRPGQGGGPAQPDDAGDVLRPAPAAALLDAAVDERQDAHALADIEGRRALGPVELVAGQAQGVDAQGLDVERDVARGGHGVGVEEDVAGPADGGDLGHGLDRPDLAVGRHDGDEDRVLGQGLVHLGRVDPPVPVDGHEGRREARPLQGLDRVEDGGVLDGRDDDVPAAGLLAQGQALDGEIVGLAAARGEIDLGRRRPDQGGDLFPGRVDRGSAASRPAAWRLWGLPNASVRNGRMASKTSGRRGVAAM